MIHAVTHAAIHSLCSCAGHMRNMISQLLSLEIPLFHVDRFPGGTDLPRQGGRCRN